MKITTIDREACRILREAVNENLADLAKELGVSLKVTGSISYAEDGGSANLKVECRVIGEDGKVGSKEADDFRRFSYQHGLPVDSLGKTFASGGHKYKLIGYSPRSHRYPMIGERVSDGRRFKFHLASIRFVA